MSIFDYFSSSDRSSGSDNSGQQVVEIIKRKCDEAGWKIRSVHDNGVVISFSTAIGNENIFVRYCGRNNDNEAIIEFSTEGFPVPKDASVAAIMALMLMERNGEMLFAHWGIETVGEDKFFTVMHSAVASTLDLEEFRAAINGCLGEKERFVRQIKNNGN